MNVASPGQSGPSRVSFRPRPVAEALLVLHSVRLLARLGERIRLLHYSRRTEEAYVHWCRVFVRFHGLRHSADMAGPEIEAILSWRVNERHVAAAIFRELDGAQRLFAQVLYGTGMRLSAALQLRIKNVDFAHRSEIVRQGKGGKDRVLMLPQQSGSCNS